MILKSEMMSLNLRIKSPRYKRYIPNKIPGMATKYSIPFLISIPIPKPIEILLYMMIGMPPKN